MTLDRIRLATLADYLAAAVAVSLPWSTSATSILVALWVVAAALTLDRGSLRQVGAMPVAVFPIALVVLALGGMLWADVAWAERLNGAGRGFDVYVGCSAGSVVASLLAGGVRARHLLCVRQRARLRRERKPEYQKKEMGTLLIELLEFRRGGKWICTACLVPRPPDAMAGNPTGSFGEGPLVRTGSPGGE